MIRVSFGSFISLYSKLIGWEIGGNIRQQEVIRLPYGSSLIGNCNPCVAGSTLYCTLNCDWVNVFRLDVIFVYFGVVLWNILYITYVSWCCPKWWQRIPLLGNGVGG
jgi:hypothetical protein